MDLRDLIILMRTRWVAIAAIAIAGGLIGLSMSLLVTPRYESRIQFYVTVAGGDTAAAAYQGSLGAQQRVQSYAALVATTNVTREVIGEAAVDRSPETVASSVSAEADARTVLLDVAVTDPEPQVAFRLAEAYGTVMPEMIRALETPSDGGNALAKVTVINPPALATDPVAPKTVRNIMLGTALGIIVGVAIVLLSNLLDRRVRGKDEIESIASAAVIGSIPFRRAEDRKDGEDHLVPFRKGHSPAAEAFRRLRTNLQFLNVDNPPRVLVVTSSVAMEGKSETSVNLSLALAESGNKVLLIEADLRRPKVVTYMSMPDKVGLTNVLSGQAEVDDVVQQSRHDGVDVLACGPLPPNPSELLASEVAQRLFVELRQKYDYVIVDTPPLLPVTDGALLAKSTDGALLVVREGRTTSDQLSQAVDNLTKADAKLLGVISVANKPVRKGTAGYYDSYYYAPSA